jgi:hypothetical protein
MPRRSGNPFSRKQHVQVAVAETTKPHRQITDTIAQQGLIKAFRVAGREARNRLIKLI